MAQPSNVFDSYDTVGIREDLDSKIYNVAPSDTPFMAMVKKSKTSNQLFEWQTDTLDTASGSNQVIQGDDATIDAVTPTVLRNNRTHISDKTARITGTQKASTKAGRTEEMSYQVSLKATALKTDMETSALANTAKVSGNATTAAVTAGVVSWIATNEEAGSGSAPTGDGSDTRTESTQRALTEALFKSALKQAWDSGGKPDCAIVGSFNKQVISSFASPNQRVQEFDKTLSTSVDVYESDFGSIRIYPNRFSPARHALLLEKKHWKIRQLRPMKNWPLAKTGDSDSRQVLVEFGLQSCNEKASAIVADCTTS
jgi:hypothetical protein